MNEDDPSTLNKSLIDQILDAPADQIAKASKAGSDLIRRTIRDGKLRRAVRDAAIDPAMSQVPAIARAFASGIAEVHPGKTRRIDELNRLELSSGICHSHDFCDANVYMHEAIQTVTGLDVAAQPLEDTTVRLWECAWDFTKACGFHRLSAVRGVPNDPVEEIRVRYNLPDRTATVALPGLPAAEAHPLEIALDWWGRSPHLQVLCYEHDSQEGDPAVCVRYDRHGKLAEVIIGRDVPVSGDFDITRVRSKNDTRDTPWEIDRDCNPVCAVGDKLRMPSGQVATVMRLRDRYRDIEEFRAYDEAYGILARMDGYPDSDPRHQVYNDVAQAWEINPLTASTTNPEDFSTVQEQPTPKADDAAN